MLSESYRLYDFSPPLNKSKERGKVIIIKGNIILVTEIFYKKSSLVTVMNSQHKLEEMTLYLTQTLTGYEVIPANFGWHIHLEDKYCGNLEYQENLGWRGTALYHIPPTLIEKLKNFVHSDSSVYNTMIYNHLPDVA